MEYRRSYGSLGIRPVRLDTRLSAFRISTPVRRPGFDHTLQVLCVIPVPIVRWALVGIAFGLSGWFLGSNIYPVLASVRDDNLRTMDSSNPLRIG